MKIIGIMGRAQHGKDTVAQAIINASLEPAVRIAFADALKDEVANFLRYFTLRIMTHKQALRLIEAKKSKWKWMRRLLQWWGTEYRRNQDQFYWINRYNERVHDAKDKGIKVIVTPDVRFKNEYSFLVVQGAVMIRVFRPGLAISTPLHSSETEMDDMLADAVLTNDHTLLSLEWNAKVMASLYIKTKPYVQSV
jgi:predicted phage tail protein